MQGYVVVGLAVGYGALTPVRAPYECGKGQRYCIPKPPKTPCRNVTVESLENGTFWSSSSEVWTAVMAMKSLENGI
ncbi:hypothetical protein SADUNF_Sadunf17G0104800 [Salix dunnii]|uniref:Uncharacterized protein n=1 Tax=Salix dunnii TaxID=1413687 RepID=A0A835J5U4_9ROSI|nr:hypothetical protein SADUNF_Sadunf17G0104800 [Salix dunnii]